SGPAARYGRSRQWAVAHSPPTPGRPSRGRLARVWAAAGARHRGARPNRRRAGDRRSSPPGGYGSASALARGLRCSRRDGRRSAAHTFRPLAAQPRYFVGPRPSRAASTYGRPLAIAAAILLVLAMTPGSRDSIVAASSSTAAVHDVHLTDNPGNWFDTGVNIAGTRSLLVVPPGDTINFIIQKPPTQTVHTVSTLAFPTGAANMPFELSPAFTGSVQVTLTTPGLYVFLCEVHPFMLGAVIVQDPATTPALNLGKTLTFNPFAV